MRYLSEDFCKKHLYPIILTLLSSLGFAFLLQSFFGFSSSILWFSLFFPFFLLPVHVLSVNGRPFLFFLLYLLFSALLVFVVVRSAGSIDEILVSYRDWWQTDMEETLPPYLLLLLLPVLLGISILYLLQRSYVSRLCTALLQLSLVTVFCVLKLRTGKLSVVFFLSYLMFLLLESAFRIFFLRNFSAQNDVSEREQRLTKVSAFTVRLCPLVLVLILLPAALPYNSSPIRWTFVRNILRSVSETANNLIQFIRFDLLNHPSDFSMSFSGYSDSGALGGGIFDSASDTLYIRLGAPLTDSIYLTGNTKNIYTGSAWKNDVSVPKELKPYRDYYLDAAELSYAVLRNGTYREPDNYFIRNTYEVKLLDYRTSTLFAAAKTNAIFGLSPSDMEFEEETDGYHFERQMKRGTQYRVHFLQPNLGSEEFLQLTEATPYLYDYGFTSSPDFSLFRMYFSDLPQGADLDALLRLRREAIYKNYTSLPDALPPRVIELANSLAEGKENAYEKMQAFEQYLRSLRYTQTPAMPPKDRDVVDYFLFDSKEGYCTYFATALSVLGRCVGIPTRYVQGYCARALNSYGEHTIRTDEAHAWTEAYIDGIGWIALDATPGYEESRYQPWHKEKKETPVQSSSENYPEWWSELAGEPTPTPQPQQEVKQNDWLLALPILLIACVTLIALFVLYVLLCRLRLNRFLRRSTPQERFYYESTQIFILMSLLYDPNRPERIFSEHTLSEFSAKFAERYSDLSKLSSHFCDDYSKIRYGSYPVTQEHCSFAIGYKTELSMLLRQEKGKVAELFYRTGELLRY